MIDPHKITNYSRNQNELEEFLIFCTLVPNKPALRTAQVLENLLSSISKNISPFDKIRYLLKNNQLLSALQKFKTGQYSRIAKCLTQLANSNLNLKTCSTTDLEYVFGIGPKTSRFFLLHSRKNQKIAVLDTHILKFLRQEMKISNVPKSTPSKNRYRELESIFLSIAEKQSKSVADLDLEIWSKYSSQ